MKMIFVVSLIDIYFLIDFFLSIFLLISFTLLIIVQLQNHIQSKNFKSYYFLIALVFGFISVFLWLLNIVTFEIEPNDDLRVLLESSLHVTFSFFFFFFYKHFESIYTNIINIKHKLTNYLLSSLILIAPLLYIVHYLGVFPYNYIYDLTVRGYLPVYVQPRINESGIVLQYNYIITTYLSHIHEVIGCYVMIFLIYNAFKFKLVKFKIINAMEFYSFVIIAFAYVLILGENILLTSNNFPGHLAYVFLIGPIFLFLIGFIFLCINYISTYPSHLMNPNNPLDNEEFRQYLVTLSRLNIDGSLKES